MSGLSGKEAWTPQPLSHRLPWTVPREIFLPKPGPIPRWVSSRTEFPPICGCGKSRGGQGTGQGDLRLRAQEQPRLLEKNTGFSLGALLAMRMDVSLTSLPHPLPPSQAPPQPGGHESSQVLSQGPQPPPGPGYSPHGHHLPPSLSPWDLRSQETDGLSPGILPNT